MRQSKHIIIKYKKKESIDICRVHKIKKNKTSSFFELVITQKKIFFFAIGQSLVVLVVVGLENIIIFFKIIKLFIPSDRWPLVHCFVYNLYMIFFHYSSGFVHFFFALQAGLSSLSSDGQLVNFFLL